MRTALFVVFTLSAAMTGTACAGRAASAPAESRSAANRDRHGPPDVEDYIARLENTSREAYLPTRRVVELLRLRGDERVADLGCGPGVLSIELSRALPRGWILAVDVEPAQLDRLNGKLTELGLDNVAPVLCAQDDSRIPKGFADWIIILDTFHHLEDRVNYLKRLAGSLAPGGRIVNIDFKDGDLPVGPPAAHKVARATMLKEFAAAGFTLSSEITEFRYHDFLVFERGG